MENLVEMELHRLVIQEKGDQQYIHLKEVDGERAFPIVIGFHEAAEINRKLNQIHNQRPLTHDLVRNVLDALGWEIDRVVINDLRNNTFFATLVLVQQDADDPSPRLVDCRPSDAIALAAAHKGRIYVAQKVLDAVAVD